MDSQNQKPVEIDETPPPPDQQPLLGGEGSFEAFNAAKKVAETKSRVMRQLLECDPRPPMEVLDAQRRDVWKAHQQVLNLGIPRQGSAIDTK